MKKAYLPILAAACFLAISPAVAQTMNYHDPFASFFDTFPLASQRLAFSNTEPKMDVADMGDKIEVKAELPGIDENKMTLTIEDGILTLSGERTQATQEQGKDYYLKEISTGSFSRSIRLPKNIDESKIDAQFNKGMLTVIIPKIAGKEETVKKIPIKMMK